MRVLIGILHLWRGGGTETHVITLANELRNLGHHVVIYTSGGPWVAKAQGMGIAVRKHSDRTSSTHHHRHRHRSSSAFRQWLREEKFDVLHAHDGVTLRNFYEAARGMRRRPKIVFTVHGPYVGQSVITDACSHADAIVAVSSNIKRMALGAVPIGKVTVIPNGIRTDVFRPHQDSAIRAKYNIAKQAFLIGYGARFTFDKVVLGKKVVSSLREFVRQHPDVHVVVAGRGSMRTITSGHHLHVAGHVEDMPTLLNACDVVIGTGRTAAEALSCAVPVVAVGNAGYFGIVTINNMSQMTRTNFADHGSTHAWTSESLHGALREIQLHRSGYRSQAKALRKVIKQRFAAGKIAGQTVQLYQAL